MAVPHRVVRGTCHVSIFRFVHITTLTPDDVRHLAPEVAATRSPDLWVYRAHDRARGWTLSVATHAPPHSGKLSLGGFRIAPLERMAHPDFSSDREAIALAVGMEEKVQWSRVTGVAGPLARQELANIVGGKCVLAPTPGSRVGEPDDCALLDFAVEALATIERDGGFRIVTGQDLGHGTLTNGESSLDYLHARFRGSVRANTALPTGEGNVQLLLGMLRGCGLVPANVSVGLIGCGNIGSHVASRLLAEGATLRAVESNPARRAALEAQGVVVLPPAERLALLAQPIHAVVVNALGGSLDHAAVTALTRNATVRVVCGSENLAMPDPADAQRLHAAGKLYAPTEMGGMMGYLTAVEEYLTKSAGEAFDVTHMFPAAAQLESVGYRATTRALESGGAMTFEDAVTSLAP
jgi:hypothetical protein